MLAGKDDAVLWMLEQIFGEAAQQIGQHYFGTAGAFLAPFVVYCLFQAFRDPPKTSPGEAEQKPVAAAPSPKYEVGPIGILIERVMISLVAAIPAGVVWAYLARGVSWVGSLGVEPGVAALGTSAITFAWLYRSRWKIPFMIIGAIVFGLILLRFGAPDAAFQVLTAAGIGVGTVAFIWMYGASWKAACVSVCSVALGLYLLSSPVPLGAIGLALCLGGVLVLIVTSPGIAAQ